MFPLVRFWEHLFRSDVAIGHTNNESTVNADALSDFVMVFKQGGLQSPIFSIPNLNRVLMILTVIDDLFGVDVAKILSRLDNRNLERLKQQIKLQKSHEEN